MINLRYHIASLVAVFLALGLGILLGSSVVSTPLQARLNADLGKYKDERDDARAEARQLRTDGDALERRIGSELAPWAVEGRFDATPFLVVVDGVRAPSWREHVLNAIVAAGAESEGTLLLLERFSLTNPDDEDELVRTMQAVVPSFAARNGRDVAVDALTLLGQRFGEPTGRALIEALEEAGFIRVEGRQGDEFPPAGTLVVVLSSSRSEDVALNPNATTFARAVARTNPTLVATDLPTGRSVVSELRSRDGQAKTLSTFDSATSDADPGGVGVVAALLAAVENRGGHFGAERGRPFVAPPASGG